MDKCGHEWIAGEHSGNKKSSRSLPNKLKISLNNSLFSCPHYIILKKKKPVSYHDRSFLPSLSTFQGKELQQSVSENKQENA